MRHSKNTTGTQIEQCSSRILDRPGFHRDPCCPLQQADEDLLWLYPFPRPKLLRVTGPDPEDLARAEALSSVLRQAVEVRLPHS